MTRTARSLRRVLRLASVLPAASWAWQRRHLLAGMATFAATVPDRLRLTRGNEVALAAKVNLALLREPRLRGADVRVGAVQGGDVCLEVGAGWDQAGEIARSVVERVAGVETVRLEGTPAAPAPSTAPGASFEATSATVTDEGVVGVVHGTGDGDPAR